MDTKDWRGLMRGLLKWVMEEKDEAEHAQDAWSEGDHPRGQPENAGEFASGAGSGGAKPKASTSAEFVSPNISNLDFKHAVNALGKERHAQVLAVASSIDHDLGLASHNTNVIGAWADGAENSIMTTFDNVSWDALKANAAMKGYLANQKQVLIFSDGEKGDAWLSSFYAAGKLDDIHQYLAENGLIYHTLEPDADGAIVHVYGSDDDTATSVQKAGKHYGTDPDFHFGRGEFLGTEKQDGTDEEQRNDARKIYEGIIASSRIEGLASKWEELRNRHSKALTAQDAWSEADHPRGQPENAGEFASAPGGGNSTSSPPDGEQPVELHPETVNVGGDLWNKQTAIRLETEYAKAAPDLEKLEKGLYDGNVKTTVSTLPQVWDDLHSADQDTIAGSWKQSNWDSALENEHDHWSTESAPGEAAQEVVRDFYSEDSVGWFDDAIEELVAFREKNDLPRIPYSTEQLRRAVKFEGIDDYEDTVPTIGFHELELKLPDDLDTETATLPGIEPRNPSDSLTKEMREDLTGVLQEAFEKQRVDVQDNLEVPDYLGDSVEEYLNEQWNQMSDEEKFSWAEDHHGELIGDSEEVEKDIALAPPKEFDPLNETSGDDYKKTQAIATALSEARATRLIVSRHIIEDEDEARDVVKKADHTIWDSWKSSSTSRPGVIMQVAAAEELGGRLRHTTRMDIKRRMVEEFNRGEKDSVKPFFNSTSLALGNKLPQLISKLEFDDKGFVKPIFDDKAIEDAMRETVTPETLENPEHFGKLVESAKAMLNSHAYTDYIANGFEVGSSLYADKRKIKLWPEKAEIVEDANNMFPEIGGYEGVKALIRAKWETSQYLLAKAGKHSLTLYRGLDYPDVAKEKTETVGDNYKRLPDTHIVRNGAASTTTDPSVANGWDGNSGRVVLRIEVPRTAVISVPAYGINVHSEHEVVVAGTSWKNWDAWQGAAPTIYQIPFGHKQQPEAQQMAA